MPFMYKTNMLKSVKPLEVISIIIFKLIYCSHNNQLIQTYIDRFSMFFFNFSTVESLFVKKTLWDNLPTNLLRTYHNLSFFQWNNNNKFKTIPSSNAIKVSNFIINSTLNSIIWTCQRPTSHFQYLSHDIKLLGFFRTQFFKM